MYIPYAEVHPATWKGRMLRDQGKGKDGSRVKALATWPHTAKELSRKKDHNRADALLMAAYGRLTAANEATQTEQKVTLF
jgi:crossover junction endodeoxyribonuclease RuvC